MDGCVQACIYSLASRGGSADNRTHKYSGNGYSLLNLTHTEQRVPTLRHIFIV